MKFNAACIQLNSGNNLKENISVISDFIKEAAKNSAFITLPENAFFMAANAEELFANSFKTDDHPAIKEICKLAKSLSKWILIGSVAVKIDGSKKLANRCLLINNNGEIEAHYDKIHLYDASVKGGESHSESSRFEGGKKAVIAQTPFGKIGLTICYDLRFPYLFRHLAKSGCEIITVPAAFTMFTGKAHWEVLLRARAIEAQSFIIAPAETGKHPSGRETYGHSLIINPWGEILSDGGIKTGISFAEIDTDKVQEIRDQLPSLMHDRDF